MRKKTKLSCGCCNLLAVALARGLTNAGSICGDSGYILVLLLPFTAVVSTAMPIGVWLLSWDGAVH